MKQPMASADPAGELKPAQNFLVVPTEMYGFSNDARGMFGPADFAVSKSIYLH